MNHSVFWLAKTARARVSEERSAVITSAFKSGKNATRLPQTEGPGNSSTKSKDHHSYGRKAPHLAASTIEKLHPHEPRSYCKDRSAPKKGRSRKGAKAEPSACMTKRSARNEDKEELQRPRRVSVSSLQSGIGGFLSDSC